MKILCLSFLALTSSVLALAPADWRFLQTVEVSDPGLIRLELPPATLDSARPGLEDLRLIDPAGQEVPFLIEQPRPQAEVRQRVRTFRVDLEAARTIVTLETGLDSVIGGVWLESPAKAFVKAVQIEGSPDGQQWQVLTSGQPVYRMADGPAQLQVEFPPGAWKFLRLSLDDQRSEPIPLSGAQVLRPKTVVPTSALDLRIKSRDETPGQTRLTLDLGGANLRIAELEIDCEAPLFTRRVTVAVPEVTEEGIREHSLAEGFIHRIQLDQIQAAQLRIPIEQTVRARELLLFVHHQDSPPLAIRAVRAFQRPTRIVFLAKDVQPLQLLSGNSQCPAPRYDLAAFADRLKQANALSAGISAIEENKAFRIPEALPGLGQPGVALDLAKWKWRRPVNLSGSGTAELELDLDVLAKASVNLADLRLIQEGRQVPYLLERTSIQRSIPVALASVPDPKRPRVSRWSLTLPKDRLPISHLTFHSPSPLFERQVRLVEEVSDGRGAHFARQLAQANWRQSPERPSRELILELVPPPEGAQLWLETDDGDNPPIELQNVRAFYPLTRLIFKSTPGGSLELVYGNVQATAPRYDLALVGRQLLAAEKSPATLAAEVPARSTSPIRETMSGSRQLIFWAALAAVVIGLLLVVGRLLPKPQ